MIQSFRHKRLEKFFKTGSKAGIQAQHATKLPIQLTALNHAANIMDMNAPGWRLPRLSGDMAKFYSISVNGNWRLVSDSMAGGGGSGLPGLPLNE